LARAKDFCFGFETIWKKFHITQRRAAQIATFKKIEMQFAVAVAIAKSFVRCEELFVTFAATNPSYTKHATTSRKNYV